MSQNSLSPRNPQPLKNLKTLLSSYACHKVNGDMSTLKVIQAHLACEQHQAHAVSSPADWPGSKTRRLSDRKQLPYWRSLLGSL